MKIRSNVIRCVVIALFGLLSGMSSHTLAEEQKINRLVIFGDSLSDDGGNNSTWFLLKTLNGMTGEEGIDHMQNWVHSWLSERIYNYTWFCENTAINCQKHEKTLLKAMVAVTKKSGAIPVSPRDHYDQGRWSNGPIWSEYLSQMLGISTQDKNNYRNESHAGGWSLCLGDKALGIHDITGSVTTVVKNMINGSLIPPCLNLLVGGYLYKHEQFEDNDLVVIFFGGNDYLNRYQDPDRVIDAQKAIIERVIENGARHIAWANMPNLSKTPRYKEGVHSHQAREISALIQEHNELLEEEWKILRDNYAEGGVRITRVDTRDIFSDILSDPLLNGFSVTDRACSTIPTPGLDEPVPKENGNLKAREKNPEEEKGSICQNAQEYFFWDSVHPTTAAHKVIAEKACEIMRREGYLCGQK